MADGRPQVGAADGAERAPLLQFYETTIVVNVSGERVPVSFGVAPARSMSEGHIRQAGSMGGLTAIVGADPDEAVPLPNMPMFSMAAGFILDPKLNRSSQLQKLWSEFRSAAAADDVRPFLKLWWRDPGHAHSPNPLDAAEALVFGAIVPFESGPLGGESIASIVGAAGNEVMAVAVLSTTGPWLLIDVPAGVIVMKASHGMGDGSTDPLQDVVKYKLLRWLAPDLMEPRGAEAPAAPPAQADAPPAQPAAAPAPAAAQTAPPASE